MYWQGMALERQPWRGLSKVDEGYCIIVASDGQGASIRTEGQRMHARFMNKRSEQVGFFAGLNIPELDGLPFQIIASACQESTVRTESDRNNPLRASPHCVQLLSRRYVPDL